MLRSGIMKYETSMNEVSGSMGLEFMAIFQIVKTQLTKGC